MTDSDQLFRNQHQTNGPENLQQVSGTDSTPEHFDAPEALFFDYSADDSSSGRVIHTDTNAKPMTGSVSGKISRTWASGVRQDEMAEPYSGNPLKHVPGIQYTGLKPTRRGYENEKKFGHRTYRLKGYTTIGKIKKKYQMESHQRLLRNLLTILMIVILIVILAVIYNPFKNVAELQKILGDDGYFGNIASEPTVSENGTETAKNPSPTS